MSEQVIPTINIIDAPLLERKDYGGMRHYISRDENGKIVALAGGVTSILSKAMPMNPYLEKWKFGFGTEVEYWRAMDTMAYYGTILHAISGKLALRIPVFLGDKEVEQWFNCNKLPKSEGGMPEYSNVHLPAEVNGVKYNAEKFRKDVIALQVFYNDLFSSREIEIVGIELPLADFVQGYAGCLDLVYRVQIGSKEIETEERDKDGIPVMAEIPIYEYWIVDLKTGSGHYYSHECQLNAYNRLLAKYLDIPQDEIKMYNLHLKDYAESTLIKHLDPDSKSKTAPYTIKPVGIDGAWEHFLQTYQMMFALPDANEKEINYDTDVQGVINQIIGVKDDENDEND